ncbi:MAG: hypothetical protein U1F76_01580 [Candidatus Competibacteraceae bacterium]
MRGKTRTCPAIDLGSGSGYDAPVMALPWAGLVADVSHASAVAFGGKPAMHDFKVKDEIDHRLQDLCQLL